MNFNFISFSIGFTSGTILWYLSSLLARKYQKNSLIKDINNQFKQLIDNINLGKSKFKTRIKDTVFIETSLKDYGNVNVIYIMDRQEISIFKDEKCIYTTTELLDREILQGAISAITITHEKKINDVIDLMGMTVSREDFEKTFNQKIQEINKIITDVKETSDIEKIINKNSAKLDIDEILDKISKTGLESLTEEEKEFLKKYK